MLRKLLSGLFGIFVFLILCSISSAFHIDKVETGKGGHPLITKQAISIKEQVHKGDEDFKKKILDQSGLIIQGTVEADKPAAKTRTHFYDPRTGIGFLGIYPSALQKGVDNVNNIRRLLCAIKRDPISGDLSSMRMEGIQNLKGETLHLLQDMACPSHTTDDNHALRHNFEKHINDHWEQIVNSQAFKDAVTSDKYRSGNYKFTDISNYWKSLADISSTYPNEEGIYNINSEGR